MLCGSFPGLESRTELWRLPTELWTHIFILCLSRDEYLTPSTQHAPLCLMFVCRSWRRLVLGTPRLWASILIDLSQRCRGVNTIPTMPDAVQTWLERSAMCPLSLEVSNHSGHWDRTTVDAMIQITEIYIGRISQWQRFRMHLAPPRSYYYPYSLLSSYNGDQAVMLESLDVKIGFPTTTGLCVALDAITNSAPRLRKYHVKLSTVFQLHTPCSQLTHIDVIIQDLRAALEIVRLSPALVDLRMQNGTGAKYIAGERDTENSWPETLIIHQSLRSLDIKTGQSMHGFLNHLQLPWLEVLKIDALLVSGAPQLNSNWSQPLFTSFISRSACSLKILRLTGSWLLSKSQFIQILELTTSSLTEVFVENYDGFCVSDGLLDRMTVADSPVGSSTCLCPMLEVLSIIDGWSCRSGAIGEMVQSRWHGGTGPRESTIGSNQQLVDPCVRLKRVRLGWWLGGITSPDRTILNALRDEGLVVDYIV